MAVKIHNLFHFVGLQIIFFLICKRFQKFRGVDGKLDACNAACIYGEDLLRKSSICQKLPNLRHSRTKTIPKPVLMEEKYFEKPNKTKLSDSSALRDQNNSEAPNKINIVSYTGLRMCQKVD